jgi:hypothetical protein
MALGWVVTDIEDRARERGQVADLPCVPRSEHVESLEL